MPYVITATNLGISKESAYSESNTSSSSGSSHFGIISNNNMVDISKSRADGGKTTAEAVEAVCGVYITRQRPITTLAAVSNSTKPAVTLMWPPPELSASKGSAALMTCPRRMTSQNAPTSFTETEVQSKTEPATAPRQNNGTWPFGPLTAAHPWPFVERKKPAISLGEQDEPDLSMYGGSDGQGESLYGTGLMASGPAAFKHKPSAGDDSVTVLVDSGTSGHYFDDLTIPSLNHSVLN